MCRLASDVDLMLWRASRRENNPNCPLIEWSGRGIGNKNKLQVANSLSMEYTREKEERETSIRGMQRGRLHVKKKRCPATNFSTVQVNRNARGWWPETGATTPLTPNRLRNKGLEPFLVDPTRLFDAPLAQPRWLLAWFVLQDCIPCRTLSFFYHSSRTFPYISKCEGTWESLMPRAPPSVPASCLDPARRRPLGIDLVDEFKTRLTTADMVR